MIPAMWTPLHYPFIGGAPRLQNELEGSHRILNLQVYFHFDGGAKINEGGSPEPGLQVQYNSSFFKDTFRKINLIIVVIMQLQERLPILCHYPKNKFYEFAM